VAVLQIVNSGCKFSTPEAHGDSIIAAAILDRLLHHSTTINIRGESYRLKDRRKAELVPPRGQVGAEAHS
jgi:DNA replication protein DnaC